MVTNKTTMKFCPMVECAKITPHSYDDGSKQVECDGACSVRRQESWRLSVTDKKQPTDGSIDAPTMSVMPSGRKAMLYPLVKPLYADHPQCYDCGKPAKVTVIETSSDSRAWLWCNMCEVG